MSIPEQDRRRLEPGDLAAERLDDWRWVAGHLHSRFETGSFATGMRLLHQVADEAERLDHHPDVDLRYGHLELRLMSHDVHGVTGRDVRLARLISEHARALGIRAAPSRVQVLDIAIDTEDASEILPFWQAVLRLDPDPHDPEMLVDPDGHMPSVWFQATDAHQPPRQRFHLDLVLPPEEVQTRMTKALSAGGTLVTDVHAPSWWVLADAQGNRVCLCTVLGRDPAEEAVG
jgi:4a-hydroxytetrahydrobiopterin dehydratase